MKGMRQSLLSLAVIGVLVVPTFAQQRAAEEAAIRAAAPNATLWLNQAAPTNDQTIEVVVTDSAFVGSPADVAVNFGSPYGTWILGASTWMPLHSLSPLTMITGDLDGNGQND